MPAVVRAHLTGMGSSEMVFVSRGDPLSEAEQHDGEVARQELANGDIEVRNLRAGDDADVEINITRALSNASAATPGGVAATFLAARSLRNRLRQRSCFRG